VRYRGEAIAAVVGSAEAIEALDLTKFPVTWQPLPALRSIESATADGADLVQPNRSGNILTRGRVIKGDVEAALNSADAVVEGEFETGFVEHAYIEPEAGFARRVGDRLELQV
jgi:CO/xanthine dehydrogenase Mo-binding subunit